MFSPQDLGCYNLKLLSRSKRKVAWKTVIFTATGAAICLGFILLLILCFLPPSKARPISSAHPVATAKVEAGKLSRTITGTANISSSSEREIPLSVSSEDEVGVISAVPVNAGKPVPYCHTLLEISGRPLLALQGLIPAYRDLHIGDTGNDVTQLQKALNSCGYSVAADGQLGKYTAQLVAKLYRNNGYAPAQNPKTRNARQDTPGKKPQAESDTNITENETASDDSLVIPRSEAAFIPANSTITALPKLGSYLGEKTSVKIGVGAPLAILELDAKQILKLREGLPIKLESGQWNNETTLPAIPNSPDSNDRDEEQNSQPTYTLRIPLNNPPNNALTTCQWSVTIGSNTTYPFTVPAAAIREDNRGTYVQKKTGDSTQKTYVEIIESGDGAVAIKGAVKTGETVLLGDK
ncbi:efflux RND transporter periplasmic adaptor subunit [uncultured Varibaculum sp.]|uniref:peptidoglycan-binding protein n=1 Tax=uncultured Varibaculum sp. TaxID=413896 RepID=UPI0025921396|nr:efflux RND transporter periplasmic adaptor subunit [uncultured Varibaculum sp.]